MKSETAHKTYLRLNKKIELAEEDLDVFRKTICPHHRLIYSGHGSSGNYNPSLDHYWYKFRCLDCEYRYTTKQEWDILESTRTKHPFLTKVDDVYCCEPDSFYIIKGRMIYV